MTKIFLDAAYAIALAAPKDQYHERAKALAVQLEKDQTRLITTRAVVLEIGNALAKFKYRVQAIELLNPLEGDSGIEIVPISERLVKRAFALYKERPDKEWGMTDCISFIVMQEQGLSDTLTTDEHFRQAGYNALLL